MINAVSVIMPTYNAMPFLPDAVDSILKQSFHKLEFLIVNQRSTDGTDEYLDSLADSRVRVIHLNKAGIGEALDLAIREARCDWVARMDADDVALPARLEREAQFIERHPHYVLVSCAFGYIGANGRRIKGTHLQRLLSPPSYDPTRDPMILDQGMLFLREAVIKAGGFRDIIPGAGVEGLDLCLRLHEASYRMASMTDVLMLNRVRSDGNTAVNFIKQRVGWKYARACSEARRAGGEEPKDHAFLRDRWPRGWQRLKIEGARQFRLAGASWGAGRYHEFIARLSMSTVLNPPHCARKFCTYFLRRRLARRGFDAGQR